MLQTQLRYFDYSRSFTTNDLSYLINLVSFTTSIRCDQANRVNDDCFPVQS